MATMASKQGLEKNKISSSLLRPVLKITQKNTARLLIMICLLMLVNSFVDATMYFFKEEGKVTYFSMMRVALYIALILYFFIIRKDIHYSKTTILILIFLLYTLLLIPFSSNMSDSFENYLKILFSMIMFTIGNNVVTSVSEFRKTQFYFLAAAYIICLQLIASNVFGIKNEGLSSYNDELITVGGGLVDNAKSLCFIILTLPILFVEKLSNKLRMILFIIILLSIVTFLLYFNRSAILGVVIGYLVIGFYVKKKSKIIRIALAICFIVSIVIYFLSPILSDIFTERIVERDITQEGRTTEAAVVWGELFSKPIHEIFLGKEIYNSDEIDFGGDLYHGRQLHVDYDALLVGTGVIGLFLYILILFSILRETMHYSKTLSQDRYYPIFKPVIFGFITASIIISFGGGLETIGFRSIFFYTCGGDFRNFKKFTKPIVI